MNRITLLAIISSGLLTFQFTDKSALVISSNSSVSTIRQENEPFIKSSYSTNQSIQTSPPTRIHLFGRMRLFLKMIRRKLASLIGRIFKNHKRIMSDAEHQLYLPDSAEPELSTDIVESDVAEDNKSDSEIKADSDIISHDTVTDVSDTVLTWAGKPASNKEIEAISHFKSLILKQNHLDYQWLHHDVHDIELLRFLRAKNGNVNEAWKMILNHAKWRVSQYGADSEFTRTAFENSPMHHEIFWLGKNMMGYPILVVRTQIHDGYYYNEDPKIFASFLVSVLEKGRQLYETGTKYPVCILLDRGGTVRRNNVKKVEKRDMSVIPNLVLMIQQVFSTIQENYPELGESAIIAPASWFFSVCYKITSRAMDSKTRARFKMIKSEHIRNDLHSIIDPSLLPSHLGGANKLYQSNIDINFDPTKSKFPILSKEERKKEREKVKRSSVVTEDIPMNKIRFDSKVSHSMERDFVKIVANEEEEEGKDSCMKPLKPSLLPSYNKSTKPMDSDSSHPAKPRKPYLQSFLPFLG